MIKERKKIRVGECTLRKETHSILDEAKPILPKQSTNKRDDESTKHKEGTKEERQTSYSNATSDEYSPVSETHQGSRSPRRCTRKVQEITKQEDQNIEEASTEYSFTGISSPKRRSRKEGEERKKTHTWSQNKRNFSKFEYEEEEEQKQEPRTNKYKRKKKEKIVEDLRDSLSSSSSVINEDYS